MAKIGVFEGEQKRWFRYDSDTEVLLKYIDKGRVNTILIQGAETAKKMKANPSDMQDILLGKEAIFGWRKIGNHEEPGFLLPDGTPAPFTPDNRNRFMTKSKRFSEFVYATCTNENKFLDDEPLELSGEDLKDLDRLLDEIGEEDLPGNG